MTTAPPDPITPGEILLEEYLTPLGISQNALARALGVSPHTISEIVLARRRITPEMSLRLGKFFRQSDEFWFNLQTICDFYELRKRAKEILALVKDFGVVTARSAGSRAAIAERIRHLAKTAKAPQGATRSGARGATRSRAVRRHELAN